MSLIYLPVYFLKWLKMISCKSNFSDLPIQCLTITSVVDQMLPNVGARWCDPRVNRGGDIYFCSLGWSCSHARCSVMQQLFRQQVQPCVLCDEATWQRIAVHFYAESWGGRRGVGGEIFAQEGTKPWDFTGRTLCLQKADSVTSVPTTSSPPQIL